MTSQDPEEAEDTNDGKLTPAQMKKGRIREDPMREEVLAKDEEFYQGLPRDEVPKLPANRLCNAQKFEENDDGEKIFVKYCDQWAGYGTDSSEGRCNQHGGKDYRIEQIDAEEDVVLTALEHKPDEYMDRASQEEEEFIRDLNATICDRVRKLKGEVDPLDRVLAKRIAIRLNIAAEASEYLQRKGLVQEIMTEGGKLDQNSALISELRKYDRSVMQDLKDLGVLNDPESKKADAMSEWRAFLDKGDR